MSKELTELLDKNLKLENNKPVVNVVFVGHVDAGKSTIGGMILLLSNMVDARTLEKYKKEAEKKNRSSWYLSWCMDINPEERDKGKTQELGVSNFIELNNIVINILDAPGHKQYIDNMIDGASRADVGVLVVSARTNEFESGFDKGGQTREHVRLLKAGNCNKLIVLVNKMDECEWNESRFEEIKTKITRFSSVIFNNGIQVIPVSGFTGENIKDKKALSYYDGPSFLGYLDQLDTSMFKSKTSDSDISILTVVEKSTSNNSISVFVKVEAGKILKNEQYAFLPSNNKIDKITCIYNEDDVEVEKTLENNTYRIRVSKLVDEIFIGQKLIYPIHKAKAFKTTKYFLAEIGLYDIQTAMTVGYSCMLHCNLQVSIAKIVGLYNLKTKQALKVLKRGHKALAKIQTESMLVFKADKNNKDRFSLRSDELTIGVGLMIKAYENDKEESK